MFWKQIRESLYVNFKLPSFNTCSHCSRVGHFTKKCFFLLLLLEQMIMAPLQACKCLLKYLYALFLLMYRGRLRKANKQFGVGFASVQTKTKHACMYGGQFCKL